MDSRKYVHGIDVQIASFIFIHCECLQTQLVLEAHEKRRKMYKTIK